ANPPEASSTLTRKRRNRALVRSQWLDLSGLRPNGSWGGGGPAILRRHGPLQAARCAGKRRGDFSELSRWGGGLRSTRTADECPQVGLCTRGERCPMAAPDGTKCQRAAAGGDRLRSALPAPPAGSHS